MIMGQEDASVGASQIHGARRNWITIGLMLGMLIAAMESTVVSTAMPTVIGELHGIRLYPWVFSAYLLTSTTTVPIYGKLSDIFGRRRVFLTAAGIFLVGSMLSGAAHSMEQLIAFRAIQGLGAGGVLPVTLTIIGDLFPMKERAKVQGLFTGIWSAASLAGPLIGAFLTEQLSWRWVFYINLPFGLLSALLVGGLLRERAIHAKSVKLDVLGSVLLTLCVFAQLVLFLQAGAGESWLSLRMLALSAGAFFLLIAFLWQEKRAEEPMLPLNLLHHSIILASFIGNILIGVMLYATDSYMPLYMQGVRGGSPHSASLVLTPLVLAWSLSAYAGAKLLVRFGFARVATFGALSIFISAVSLMFTFERTPTPVIVITMIVLGMGLGPCSMAFLVSAQNAVSWRQRGVVTASSLFFRTIGGTIGVGALGAALNARMAHLLAAAPAVNVSANALLNPQVRGTMNAAALSSVRHALEGGLHLVFVLLAVCGLAGFVSIVLISRRSESRTILDMEQDNAPAEGLMTVEAE